MAFNQHTLDRIITFFYNNGKDFKEKRMFGGVCIMVDDKMCCATHIDKQSEQDYLLCRIGEAAQLTALEEPYCIPMEFTGRSMKGYVYITEEGFNTEDKLATWLQMCLDYNPHAKKGTKKKP